MKNDNQDYRRSPLQLANIAAQKKAGQFGGRFAGHMATPAPTTKTWWDVPPAEFKAAHTAQVPRMTAVTTTYRFAHPDDF